VAALCAAGAVTVGRIALLQVWDEFAASTDRSNAQVFGGAGRRRGRRASRRAPGARGRGFISRRAASRGRRGCRGWWCLL
jgi:hypothetical protein